MSSIDNRVVQMQFNNEEFEKGISDTLKSIENLNQTLSGLGNVSFSIGVTSGFGDINNSIDEAGSKFNALEELAIGALRNIGEKASNVALDLVESFTLDPISEGYSKYESQVTKTAGLINAAMFQGAASEEEAYDKVTKSLEKIQWYADATSYSYDSMVSALLAFVNSNVPMDDAVDIVMGIGNSFSYAGAVATEVSPAFYTLSKSMGESAIMYKSVINTLQNTYHVLSPQVIQSYLDTAEALGYLEKEEDHYITTSKAFEKGITKQQGGKRVSADALNTVSGWLNGEVLQSVYKNYSTYADAVYNVQYAAQEAADGGVVLLSDAMEEVNRQMEEGTLVIDEVSKIAFISAQEAVAWSVTVDAVKDAVSSAWKSIIQDVVGDYKEAKTLFTSIQDYLIDVFTTPLVVMHEVLKEWNDKGGRDALLAGLGNIVKSCDNMVAAIKNIFKEIFPAANAQQIINASNKFKELTEKLLITEDVAQKLTTPFKLLGLIFQGLIGAFKAAYKLIKSVYTAFKPVVEVFETSFYYILDSINKIVEYVNSLGILDNMATQLSYTFSDAKKKIAAWYQSFTNGRSVLEAVVEELSGLDFSILDVKETFSDLELFLQEFWKSVEDIFLNKLKVLVDSVKEKVINVVQTVIGAIAFSIQWIEDNFNEILTTIVNVWSTITSTVEKGIEKIKGFFEKLITSTNEVVGKSGNKFSQYMDQIYSGETRIERIMSIIKQFLGLIKQVFKIEILKNIAKMFKNLPSITKTLKSFVSPLNELTKALKQMTKSVKVSIIKKIAVSILLLSASMLLLSYIPTEKLGDTFGYIVQVLGLVAGMVFIISRSSDNFAKASATVAAMGVAVLLMTISLLKLAQVAGDPGFGSAFGALLSMITMLLIVVVALGKMNNEKTALGSAGDVGLMMLKLASGLLIISTAVKNLSELKEDQLLHGVVAMFAVMVTMALFIKAMSMIDGNDLGSKVKDAGTALILLSIGMGFMAGAVSVFGNMGWEKLVQGIGAVVAIIISLVFASQQIANNEKQLLALAGSMMMIAAALITMAAGIFLIGSIKPEPLIIGVSTLFIMIGILASISKTMKADSLMKISGAVAIMGLAMIALAAGIAAIGAVPILLLVKGLIAFAVIFMVLVAAAPLIEAAGAGFIKFAAGALLLGLAMMAIAAGITALSGALLLIDAGMLAEKITDIISAVCAAIVASADSIIHAIFSLIAAIIAGLGEGLGMIISSIGTALNGLIGGICSLIGIEYPGSIAASIALLFGYLLNKFTTEWGPAIWTWFKGVIAKFVNWLGTAISSVASKAWNWVKNSLDDIKTKVGNKFDELKNKVTESGKNIIKGLFNGIQLAVQNTGLYKTISSIGDKIIGVFNGSLGIHSPSIVFAEAGSYIVQGLANGITDNSNLAEKASEALGLSTITSLKDTLTSGITDGIDADLTLTPVLDLSEIEAGTAEMSDMLNIDNLSTTVGTIGEVQSPDFATATQLASLNTSLGSLTSGGSYGSVDIAGSIKEALNGVGVYADSKKIGKLVTIYQANTSRAGGY